MNHQEATKEFMVKAGQSFRDKPGIPEDEKRKLHASLIWEECLETIRAMGFEPNQDLDLEDKYAPLLEESFDGLIDLDYVLNGAANSWGLDMEKGFKEVHEANMRKFGPGGHRREDGKWIKPADWKEPNLQQFL